jgi:hypothetical protein
MSTTTVGRASAERTARSSSANAAPARLTRLRAASSETSSSAPISRSDKPGLVAEQQQQALMGTQRRERGPRVASDRLRIHRPRRSEGLFERQLAAAAATAQLVEREVRGRAVQPPAQAAPRASRVTRPAMRARASPGAGPRRRPDRRAAARGGG